MNRTAASILACILALAGAAHAADDSDAGDAAFRAHDYPTAIKLLMPLAQKGNMVAELDIGLMYYSGNGFAMDRVEGAKWFLAAARQGNIGAQTDIGIAYITGEGKPRNLVLAYMWFSLATSHPEQAGPTNYRDHVASEMTPDQIKQAQDMAHTCSASGYQQCGEP